MTANSRGFIDITAPVQAAARAEVALPRRRVRIGSVRHSVTLLVLVAAAGEVLLAVTDGVDAVAFGLAAFVAAGIVIARYALAGSARDSGLRRPVRLLGHSQPGLGSWEWLVHNALGAEGPAYLEKQLRPQLQRLFAARLAEEYGTDLYRAPARASELIGPDLWPWLDPTSPAPHPSIPEPTLRALLTRLESLQPPGP
jgi:hypothetical protein